MCLKHFYFEPSDELKLGKLSLQERKKYYSNYRLNRIMLAQILDIWGCIPELSKQCVDMTNSSSTYLGIVAGALIGGIITWWIYNRQNKTSKQQESILHRINKLEEGNRKILIHLELTAKKSGDLLERIISLDQNLIELDKKIRELVKEWLHKRTFNHRYQLVLNHILDGKKTNV